MTEAVDHTSEVIRHEIANHQRFSGLLTETVAGLGPEDPLSLYYGREAARLEEELRQNLRAVDPNLDADLAIWSGARSEGVPTEIIHASIQRKVGDLGLEAVTVLYPSLTNETPALIVEPPLETPETDPPQDPVGLAAADEPHTDRQFREIAFLPDGAIIIDGETVEMAPEEYRAIQFLVAHQGESVSPRELWNALYPGGRSFDSNALLTHRAHMNKLLNRDELPVFITIGRNRAARYELRNVRITDSEDNATEQPFISFLHADSLVAFLRGLNETVLPTPPSQKLLERLSGLDEKGEIQSTQVPKANVIKQARLQTLAAIKEIIDHPQRNEVLDKLADQNNEALWSLLDYFIEQQYHFTPIEDTPATTFIDYVEWLINR